MREAVLFDLRMGINFSKDMLIASTILEHELPSRYPNANDNDHSIQITL